MQKARWWLVIVCFDIITPMPSPEHIQNMSSANMESDNDSHTLTKEQLKQKADTIHTKLDESIQQAKSDNTPDQTTKQSILDKIPQQLRPQRKWQASFFPGSALVRGSGAWVSPYLRWSGGVFDRNACRVEGGWGSGGRVVILER